MKSSRTGATMRPERRILPKVLLITPPMVQFNSPYAATPALAAFLASNGVPAEQADLSLELALKLFSRKGIGDIVEAIARSLKRLSGSAAALLKNRERYINTVDIAVRYLQTGDPALGDRIAAGLLPRGPRFGVLEEMKASGADCGGLSDSEMARMLAGLFIDDIADAVRDGVDIRFRLSRYGERLAVAAFSFEPIRRALARPPGVVDGMLDDLAVKLLRRVKPDIVGITVPFPGCVYGAFRVAACVRKWNPKARTVAGGGYVNTELRSLSDPAVFRYFDHVAYDDGELPLLRIVERAAGLVPASSLIRTRSLVEGKVILTDAGGPPLRHRSRPAPSYAGLRLGRYCGMAETANPMARLWTERPWLKLAMARGCYWHRCAFCDTELDYIRRFDPADAATVVGWMEDLIEKTGVRDFHFVDEAAPPALLKSVSERLFKRGIRARWWTNIRFERAFDRSLASLMARAGCVAVTGGLECAEESLLEKMGKGIMLKQSTLALKALASAGILTHAYLMYGFPGQTLRQTVDALEYVRQLFESGCLDSAYWHRFALTVHSSIFREPARFGVRLCPSAFAGFAMNEAPFRQKTGADHDRLGESLRRATYNFMHGVGVGEDVRSWFPPGAPKPRLSRLFVAVLNATHPGGRTNGFRNSCR